MEEDTKNISMVNRAFILIVFVLFAHGLHAQQTMCKDTYRTVSDHGKGKSVERKDTTKFLACPVCKGLGIVGKEAPIGPRIMPKDKKNCKRCGDDYWYWDNIRHFHIECKMCRGKGRIPKNI